MPLHDILPPIAISDHSFVYIFGFMLGVIALVVYFYRLRKKQTLSPSQILEQCDFNDAKKTALQFAYYGRKIFKDEVKEARFLALNERLKSYKYGKNRTAMPQELEESIKELLEEVRAEHG